MKKKDNQIVNPYRKKSSEKYKNYPAEVVLKRVLKYAWKSKFLIISSLLILLLTTYVELYQPKLINKVLDDHLLGIQTTWVLDENGSVSYNSNKYNKILSDDITLDDEIISLVYFDGAYYIINGIYYSSDVVSVDEKSNSLILKDDILVEASVLSKEELKEFYAPSINPIIRLLVTYGILILIIIVLRYCYHVFFLTASMRLTLDIRKDAFSKLNRLPLK